MTRDQSLVDGDRVRVADADSVVLGTVTWVAPGNLGTAATIAVDGCPGAVLTLCRSLNGPGWYIPRRPGAQDRLVAVTLV